MLLVKRREALVFNVTFAAAIVLCAVAALVGCSGPTGPTGNRHGAEYRELPDGRTVLCVYYNKVGGVSCDWDGAR